MKIAVWNVAPVLSLLAFAPVYTAHGATLASQTVVEKTKEGAEKTKDAVVKGAKVVADKTEDGVSKTGEVMTDGWITTRINQRFVGEKLLKDSNINVDTEQARRDAEGHRDGSGGPCQGGDGCEAHGRRAACRQSADDWTEAHRLSISPVRGSRLEPGSRPSQADATQESENQGAPVALRPGSGRLWGSLKVAKPTSTWSMGSAGGMSPCR